MGCTTSKDGKQPNTKKIGKSKDHASPSKQSPIKGQTPMKLKEIDESELQKHKPTDIIGYVKAGNLSMINGLIKYYKLENTFVLLKGH